jgi:carboxyl-terminal processing protease
MIKHMPSGRYAALAIIVLALGFTACKKDKTSTPDKTIDPVISGEVNTKQTPTTNRRELTNDSLFLYAKQIYYWNSSLPTYDAFEPRNYNKLGNDLANYKLELLNITKFSSYEVVSGSNNPKYSYMEDANDANSNKTASADTEASVDLDDVGFDMGFIRLYRAYGTDDNYKLYVTAVQKNSPASRLGITRGTIITNIGGQAIGANFNAEQAIINNLFNGLISSTTLSGIRTDGTTFTNERIKIEKYTSSPVYKAVVLSSGGKKVGYLSLARFSILSNPDSGTPSDTRIDPVFADFAANGITDLVVDLRYNGGGSVQTAEYLLNLIAPSTASGVMYKEVYNNTMKTGNATILKNQPLTDAQGKIRYSSTTGKMLTYDNVDWSDRGNIFNFEKKGQLNGIKNIVFLVSGNTASASEMLINCIKPHVQSVKLVGTKTYGKPVGFFPVILEKHYEVRLASFETKNSRDEGGYYTGIVPDFVDVGEVGNGKLFDDGRYDFGDPRESYLNKALSILAPVLANSSSSRTSSVNEERVIVPSQVVGKLGSGNETFGFKGMVETRHRLK